MTNRPLLKYVKIALFLKLFWSVLKNLPPTDCSFQVTVGDSHQMTSTLSYASTQTGGGARQA
jgi:hypothetical protein